MENKIIRQKEEIKPKPVTSWGTHSEKQFLKKLGTHNLKRGSPVTVCSPTEYLRRLKKYRDTIGARVRWGSIDKKEIEKFLDLRIENYERSCTVQRLK